MSSVSGWFSRIPLPICGLGLGTIGLANLIKPYSLISAQIVAGVSVAFLLLFIIRSVMYPQKLKEDLLNPVAASVAGTFSMTLMLLSGYFDAEYGKILLLVAVGIHILLIVNYTVRILPKLELKSVHPGIFVTYVGIAAAAITAPAVGLNLDFLVWFGLVCAVIIMIAIIVKMIKAPGFPNPVLPMFCIMVAPFSLCLVAYASSIGNTPEYVIPVLCIVSIILFIAVLANIPRILKNGFFPSYAAMTFPFTIFATAVKVTSVNTTGLLSEVTEVLSLPLLIFAAVMVIHAICRYAIFLSKKA